MRKVIRGALIVGLALLLLVSTGTMIYGQLQQAQNEQAQAQARELVDLPDPDVPLAEPELPAVPIPQFPDVMPEPDPEPEQTELPSPEPFFDDAHARTLLDMDLAALRGENGDVIGWIEIPGTPISYPLLQGADNQYYLNHNWKKEYNAGGSIFMEAKNRADFDNFNTLIYGHRMSDNSMFNSLRHYTDQEYAAQHPYIYIATDEGVRVYEVFAAMKVTVTDPVYWLITDQTGYMEKMIAFCVENSVIESELTPRVENRFLTLSTCTGLTVSDDRWVVIAVEMGTVSR